MKERNTVGSVISEDNLLFTFYLFMLVCGFVAGTMIWKRLDIPLKPEDILPEHTASVQVFLRIALPAAAAFAVLLLLALFAGGWIVLPAVVYLFGSVFGCFSCVLFSETADTKTVVLRITLSAAYLCCAAVLVYFSVFTHLLSRRLSGGGGCGPADYGRCLRSAALTATVIAVISGVFSRMIFFAYSLL